MDGLALRNGIGFFKRLLGSGADGVRADSRLQTASGSRMLVVDDSPTICAVLGKMLGQDGYAVSKALDGESAIELARSELPSLIFLDIVLPGINGFAVLRALRHDELTRHIPIVMISGNPQATEQFYAQRFGADDFIRKPFGRADVAASIDQLVRSGRLAARDVAFERMLAVAMLQDAKPSTVPSLAT
ncbi:response regulator [Rhodanobacter sp. C01]|uniref:response regulator n=1 Tax=Rhodanobacter sp. C01 TaxID=1945856 RepID=UPI000986DA70|nr:response regulator [Rhodanobacter sp. C01]OOG51558.1 response regulator [Rhodanobacter sp. C01]